MNVAIGSIPVSWTDTVVLGTSDPATVASRPLFTKTRDTTWESEGSIQVVVFRFPVTESTSIGEVDEEYWSQLEDEVESDRRAGVSRMKFDTVEELLAHLKKG